jgi:hypothetical protein
MATRRIVSFVIQMIVIRQRYTPAMLDIDEHVREEHVARDSTHCFDYDPHDCVVSREYNHIRQNYTPAMPVTGEYQSRDEECADYSPKEWNAVWQEYNQRRDEECANYTSDEWNNVCEKHSLYTRSVIISMMTIAWFISLQTSL